MDHNNNCRILKILDFPPTISLGHLYINYRVEQNTIFYFRRKSMSTLKEKKTQQLFLIGLQVYTFLTKRNTEIVEKCFLYRIFKGANYLGYENTMSEA